MIFILKSTPKSKFIDTFGQNIIYIYLRCAVSILLLLLLLYNIVGYYVLFVARQYQVNYEMQVYLDKNDIDKSQTFVIKIPVMLPYQVDWKNDEISRGSFQYQGKYYEKVKQILKQDTLFVYCIENKQKTDLKAEITLHTQQNLGESASQIPTKNGKVNFNFLQEYLPTSIVSLSFTPHLLEVGQYPVDCSNLTSTLNNIPSPPPKFGC